MARDSTGYTIGFAVAVCVLCGIGVAGAAVALGPRQAENKILDQQKQVLLVAGLMQPGQQVSPDEVKGLFTKNIRPEVIKLKTGEEDKSVKAEGFDQRRAQKDPATSTAAPDNAAKVFRLPNNALVYHVLKDGKTDMLILPIEGYGLWSVLYGYLAVDKDANTIKGITFYAHAETPGLGGEVDRGPLLGAVVEREGADGAVGKGGVDLVAAERGAGVARDFHPEGRGAVLVPLEGAGGCLRCAVPPWRRAASFGSNRETRRPSRLRCLRPWQSVCGLGPVQLRAMHRLGCGGLESGAQWSVGPTSAQSLVRRFQ